MGACSTGSSAGGVQIGKIGMRSQQHASAAALLEDSNGALELLARGCRLAELGQDGGFLDQGHRPEPGVVLLEKPVRFPGDGESGLVKAPHSAQRQADFRLHSGTRPIIDDARRRMSCRVKLAERSKRLTHAEQNGGHVLVTTDPGKALITGKCSDFNRTKGPVLRGLAARAPYFHNGAAATLMEVVDFYDQRFQMQLTTEQKRELVAFLSSL